MGDSQFAAEQNPQVGRDAARDFGVRRLVAALPAGRTRPPGRRNELAGFPVRSGIILPSLLRVFFPLTNFRPWWPSLTLSVARVIPGLRPVNQVEIRLALAAADSERFRELAYLTINAVPVKSP